MKYDQLKSLSLAELYNKAAEFKKESLGIRILTASSQPTNKNRLRSLRRDLARIKTRLNELKTTKV